MSKGGLQCRARPDALPEARVAGLELGPEEVRSTNSGGRSASEAGCRQTVQTRAQRDARSEPQVAAAALDDLNWISEIGSFGSSHGTR